MHMPQILLAADYRRKAGAQSDAEEEAWQSTRFEQVFGNGSAQSAFDRVFFDGHDTARLCSRGD
jgi:hypothetical protein